MRVLRLGVWVGMAGGRPTILATGTREPTKPRGDSPFAFPPFRLALIGMATTTLSASTWAMSKPNASAAAQETAKLWENTHGGVSPSSRAVGSAFQDLSTTKSLPSPPKIHEMSASFELPTVQKSWTHAHVRSAAPFHSAQARALAHNSRNAT